MKAQGRGFFWLNFWGSSGRCLRSPIPNLKGSIGVYRVPLKCSILDPQYLTFNFLGVLKFSRNQKVEPVISVAYWGSKIWGASGR